MTTPATDWRQDVVTKTAHYWLGCGHTGTEPVLPQQKVWLCGNCRRVCHANGLCVQCLRPLTPRKVVECSCKHGCFHAECLPQHLMADGKCPVATILQEKDGKGTAQQVLDL